MIRTLGLLFTPENGDFGLVKPVGSLKMWVKYVTLRAGEEKVLLSLVCFLSVLDLGARLLSIIFYFVPFC